MVVAISGSGNSANILQAVEVAHRMGGITIGLSGFDGGQLSTMVDVPVVVPCDCMEQIEDVHVVLCHLMCTVLRERMQRIEPPLWRTQETSEFRKEGSSLAVPLPSMALQGEGCW